MIELHLTEHESRIMVSVLESYLSDLRMEIADTDRMAVRDILKERKAAIIKVISVLKESQQPHDVS